MDPLLSEPLAHGVRPPYEAHDGVIPQLCGGNRKQSNQNEEEEHSKEGHGRGEEEDGVSESCVVWLQLQLATQVNRSSTTGSKRQQYSSCPRGITLIHMHHVGYCCYNRQQRSFFSLVDHVRRRVTPTTGDFCWINWQFYN